MTARVKNDPKTNRKLRIVLDCDVHALEFYVPNESNRLLVLPIPQDGDKRLSYYPYMEMYEKDTHVKMCWDG